MWLRRVMMNRSEKEQVIKEAIKEYATKSGITAWPPAWHNTQNMQLVDDIVADAVNKLEAKDVK